ncbi:MAG: Ig-like domain-containing protein [Gemmatimonadales bacterium]
MRFSSGLTAAGLAVGGWLALACGDSSGPGAPALLVVAGGDGQAECVGATLPVPLRVTATGSNGEAFRGATISWAVIAGAASLAPSSSVTDVAGSAVTTLTLGGQVGPVTIRASAAGVTPVTFSATARDPLEYVASYTLGESVSGVLASTDCVLGEYYNDFYGHTASAQQGLTITMSSSSFDTWVDLYTGAGDYLAFNDDIDLGVIQDSELHAIIAPGSYIIAPSSFGPYVTGPYTFAATTRSQMLADCELVWVTQGVTITDSLTTTDCTNPSGPFYSDSVALIAYGGSVLQIAQRSAEVNAKLTLYRVINEEFDGILVASNDDSATGTTTDAFLSFTVPQSAAYILVIGSAAAGEMGAYTLEISSSTPALAPANELETPLGRLGIGAGLNGRGTKPPPWRAP